MTTKIEKTKKAKATTDQTVKTKKRKKASVNKKEEAAKQLIPVNNAALMEKVTSTREVKYIYPEGCNEPLDRKKFRQLIRSKIKNYIVQLSKLNEDTKEYRRLNKEFKAFKSANVKDGATI